MRGACTGGVLHRPRSGPDDDAGAAPRPIQALCLPVPRFPFPVSGLPAVVPACRNEGGFPPLPLGTGVPRFPAPRFPFPVPGFWELSTTAYAHSSMSQTIKFVSKSIKKATFSVKKGSKRRAFRHAHLNILGGHPLWR
jgi:hypothetical protein